MDRRTLIAGAATAAAWAAAAKAQPSDGPVQSQALPPAEPPPGRDFTPRDDTPPPRYERPPAADGPAEAEAPPAPEVRPSYPATTAAQAYDRNEVINGASNFLGVSSESAAAAVERIFKDQGRPTAYIAGEEGSAAFFGGVRYGRGLLYMKGHDPLQVYWQGPTVGFDWGGNASRSFTLCYNLQYPDMIFRRFPGVEGSAYLIAGLGVNYQRADGITLAPIRTGLGLRLGANVGYLAYSRKRRLIPL